MAFKPHVLGIDDGPFEKGQAGPVPIVAVMLECPHIFEAMAVSHFEVDGEDASEFLADWISGLRCHPTLQGVVLDGVTIAGLGMVDIEWLAARLDRPVLVANRRNPALSRLHAALEAAGLEARIPILERTPAARQSVDGLYFSWAGTSQRRAEMLLRASIGKSQLPEPLRIAHIVARALATGESRGRA